MKLTEPQRKAIETLDADVCVTAGAGSGKTLVLALRYIEILKRGMAEVGGIVAITFTEKAAREMRERIRKYCDDEIERASGDALGKWRGHKQDLEGARISTIHGLCSRILRENPVEAGVDPEFAVMDENAATILAGQVVDEAVEELLTAEDEHLRRVIEEFGVRKAKGHLKFLLGRLEDADRAGQFLAEHDDGELLKLYSERLVEAQADIARGIATRPEWKANVAAMRANPSRKKDDKLNEHAAVIQEADKIIRESKDSRKVVDALTKVIELNLRAGSKGEETQVLRDSITALRDMVKDEKEFGARITEADLAAVRVARDLLAAHDEARRRYQDAKNEAGVLTFEDLEIKTRGLLAGNGGVREELQRNIRFILVDEFQDVNPIQQEIIKHLAGKGAKGKARPNLFFVGDDKQSIFRFRGADVEVFSRTRDDIASGGRTVSLDTNFRTVRDGVDFANALFGGLMDAGRARQPYEAVYQNIKAERGPLAGGPFAEMNLLRYEKDNKPGADELRLMEARAVAKKIQELTSSGEARVFDEDEKKWVAPRYKHIAVICRQLKYLVYAYERAFEEAGIRYHVTTGSDFYRRQEVRDVLNVLRVIDNPANDYALVGALRSPMFALSDESLYWLSALDGDSFAEKFRSGAEPAEMADEEKEKLANARAAIAMLQPLKDRVSLPELINRILAATGFEAVLATTFNGTRKIANLRKMAEVARGFEARGIFSLRDFIAYIGDFVTEEMRESQAAVEEEEKDVVRILTVHKAKGLEFPIVMVPDICPQQERSRDRDGIGLSRELGLVARLRERPGGRERPDGIYGLHALEKKSKEDAEEKRLLYVAATRARDRLFFSACLQKGAAALGWLGDIAETLGLQLADAAGGDGAHAKLLAVREREAAEFRDRLDDSKGGKSRVPGIIKALETAAPEDSAETLRTETLPPSQAAKGSFNPTELVEYEYCPRKYYYHFVCGYPQILAGSGKEGAVPAVAIGDISHRLFEMLRPDKRDEQMLEAIRAEGQFTKEQTAEVMHILRVFLERYDKTELAGRIASARETWEEASFAARCGDALIEGKMDKVFRDESGALNILDYKSDLVPDGKFAEKLRQYRLQLAAYAIGLKAALGEGPRSAGLYFFRYGEIAELPISDNDIEKLRAEILRVVVGIRANRFERTREEPCSCGYQWLCQKRTTK